MSSTEINVIDLIGYEKEIENSTTSPSTRKKYVNKLVEIIIYFCDDA